MLLFLFFSSFLSLCINLTSIPSLFLFCNCLLLTDFLDKFGMNFAKFCVALRNDLSVSVFVGGFSVLIASVFSLFGLIMSCEMVCPTTMFLSGRSLTSFRLLCILRFLNWLGLFPAFLYVVLFAACHVNYIVQPNRYVVAECLVYLFLKDGRYVF